MDILVEVLNENGFNASKPNGSFFLYVAAPKSVTIDGATTEFLSGEDFSQWLITNELISTVPWDDCGNFVRFSVTFAAQGEDKEKEIVSEIGQRLAKYAFQF